MTRFVAFLLLSALLTSAAPLRAQSLLDRPPNISGDWIVPGATVQAGSSVTWVYCEPAGTPSHTTGRVTMQ